jgi:hypothetical protein
MTTILIHNLIRAFMKWKENGLLVPVEKLVVGIDGCHHTLAWDYLFLETGTDDEDAWLDQASILLLEL